MIRHYSVEGHWKPEGERGVRGHVGSYHRTLSTYLNDLVRSHRKGFTLGQAFYRSPAIFEAELDQFLGAHWIAVGHVSELPQATGVVSFVAIDFERQSLDTVLERAGHNRSSPTCWIWEGVVMYLTRDAMRATLAGIAGRSATGSKPW